MRKDALNFQKEIEDIRPEAVFKLEDDGYFNAWCNRITINPEEMTVDYDETLSESVYVSGGRVDSICEFSQGQLLLAIQSKNAILIAKNWVIVHQTEIEGNFSVSESMLLPEFESDSFPFMIEADKKSYNLVNAKTGTRTVLIRASAKLDVRQHGMRVKALDNGRFSIDFPVAQLNEIDGQEN